MQLFQKELTFTTEGRSTVNITAAIAQLIKQYPLTHGLCNLFLKHTSASLIICENYDAQVRKDLENFLSRLIPDGDPLFQHTIEGQDDMPAHIRTILTQTSLTIPIQQGQLALGTWQGIYLYEHRYAAHKRHVLITGYGEC